MHLDPEIFVRPFGQPPPERGVEVRHLERLPAHSGQTDGIQTLDQGGRVFVVGRKIALPSRQLGGESAQISHFKTVISPLSLQALNDEAMETVDNHCTKADAQIWISLYNLMSKKATAQKYEINNFRKTILTKLSGNIKETTEFNLGFLKPFKKWLLELELGVAPINKEVDQIRG